jgi:hypothetical protein
VVYPNAHLEGEEKETGCQGGMRACRTRQCTYAPSPRLLHLCMVAGGGLGDSKLCHAVVHGSPAEFGIYPCTSQVTVGTPPCH